MSHVICFDRRHGNCMQFTLYPGSLQFSTLINQFQSSKIGAWFHASDLRNTLHQNEEGRVCMVVCIGRRWSLTV